MFVLFKPLNGGKLSGHTAIHGDSMKPSFTKQSAGILVPGEGKIYCGRKPMTPVHTPPPSPCLHKSQE